MNKKVKYKIKKIEKDLKNLLNLEFNSSNLQNITFYGNNLMISNSRP